ncbi:kinase-like protein [Penicillium cf. griseofulvum]|nr:kinase-like protein [Penicillium cf. griseofulvum]
MTESPPDEVLYEDRNLHIGHRYIKKGNILLPCPSSVDPLSLEDEQELIHVLDKQMGRLVIEWDASWVTKSGFGVRSAEAEAMKLVSKNTEVPVPEVLFTDFSADEAKMETETEESSKPNFHAPKGLIAMTIIPGIPLQKKWDSLDDEAKESICLQLWDLISKIRNIARPQELEGPYQCAADGSPSHDPMLEDLQNPVRPLTNDLDLRARIYERYLRCGGSRYKNQLLDMLPRSERSAFTHADIAPRNVMVDEQNMVTGILDWESAGWYPDYWEYAQIMRPAFWGDWSVWMEKTAPQRWDLEGINASRKVLF